jgi:hypothetical protein
MNLVYPPLMGFYTNINTIYCLSLIHNIILIMFSGYTFVTLFNFIYSHGIVFETGYYFNYQAFDDIIYYFYISKYYEFIDILLVYIQNKNPLFLQKYHHVGAVICWYLCYSYKIDGIWIATLLNSFVHTIMYSYYLCCQLKINYVRRFKQSITTLQLCQLTPQPLCLWLYYNEKQFNYNILVFFTAYTIGLVIMFFNFYYKNYSV